MVWIFYALKYTDFFSPLVITSSLSKIWAQITIYINYFFFVVLFFDINF